MRRLRSDGWAVILSAAKNLALGANLEKNPRVWVILWVCALAFSPFAAAQAPPKPWTKEQILKMLNGDMAPRHIAELARQRGIDFPITPELRERTPSSRHLAG